MSPQQDDARQPPQRPSSRYSPPTVLQSILSWRAIMTLQMHLALVLMFSLMLNMPFVLVCMMGKPAAAAHNSSVVMNITSRGDGSSAAAHGLPNSSMFGSAESEIKGFSAPEGFVPGGFSTGEGLPNMSLIGADDGTSSITNGFSVAEGLSDSSVTASGVDGSSAAEGSTGTSESQDDGVQYAQPRSGEFDWDSSTQGLLLSSSMMLSFVTPLLVDYFCRKIGGKRLMLVAMLTASCLSLLQPAGARLSPYVLVALRIGIGSVVAMVLPLTHEIFSWWAPNSEKVIIVSIASSGSNTWGILTSFTSGFLCAIPVDNGWPFIFYTHGSFGVLWCLVWYFTGSVKPEDHPYISENEKQYIADTRHAMDKNQKRTSPPYKQIFSSVPVWGCLIMQVLHMLCGYILLIFVPIYFSTALGFNVQAVGMLYSLMGVARIIGQVSWGLLSNVLLQRTRLHTTACRKLIQCSGYYLSVMCLLALAFVRERVSAVTLLVLVNFLHSCSSASAAVAPLDIAPRYAAFLNGMIITISIIAVIPGPFIVSIMVQHGTWEEWRNYFISLLVISAFAATCFLVMGSSKLQSWARPSGTKDTLQIELPDSKPGRRSSCQEEVQEVQTPLTETQA
ncbi:putative transporter slc-17.2 isoform X2 [Babylonia areolata]